MLQQTQVTTVIPYYRAFIRRLPTVAALARATEDEVLALWSGLGYYARARHLHAAARQMAAHGLPSDLSGWRALPGVGRSTAAAVRVFAYGERQAILDGNVKRVFARVFAVDAPPNSAAGTRALWAIAEAQLPSRRTIQAYTQGLMDLGATVCRRRQPLCGECPLASLCRARQEGRVGDYPVRVKRADKPTREVVMILLRQGRKVLLEKRPGAGIWGGLWSLPEAATVKGGLAVWRRRLILQAGRRLSFSHSFTHYHLRATVVVCECERAAVVRPPYRWCSPPFSVGLPAPIKRLLDEVYSSSSDG